MSRTTIFHVPHPDDDALYVGAYATVCAARGDRMILVAWTDGGSSGARPAGWTVDELMRVRRLEQEAAWRALSGGQTEIRRMGCIDSKDTALRSKVRAYAEELEAQFGPEVEHYAAAANGFNQGVDHDAVALGLRDAEVRVARFAKRCYDTGGMVYKPVDLAAVQRADSAYSAFGHASVPTFWSKLRDLDYISRVIA